MSVPHRKVTFKGTIHWLVAVFGWVLFVHWWNRVLPQLNSREAVVALVFIGITVLATAVVTLLWVRHNVDIFRRKGPRRRLTTVVESRDTDILGRKILHSGPAPLTTASHVVVSVEGETKTYEAEQARIWT